MGLCADELASTYYKYDHNFYYLLTCGGCGDWDRFSHNARGTKIIICSAIFQVLLLLITAPVTSDRILVRNRINPPLWNKSLGLFLKPMFRLSKAPKRFLDFLNFPFSLDNLWLPFRVFMAHSAIAFNKSSLAEVSSALLACGLASLRTWRNCSCDLNQFITFYRCTRLSYFAWKYICSKPK